MMFRQTLSRREPIFIKDQSARDYLKERIKRVGRHGDGEQIISQKGGLQNWLIDLRHVFLDRQALTAFATSFWQRFDAKGAFQIAGMETAAIPLLTAVLLMAPERRVAANGFIIRKQRKPTGLGRVIEGEIIPDVPIVLIDDIFNSGSSAEKARNALETEGFNIDALFVVIDYRSRKGQAWQKDNHIAVQSLFTLDDFGLTLRGDQRPPSQKYQLLWRRNVSGAFPFYIVPKSTPLLVDKTLYRGSDSGLMHAFDATSGAILWEFQATGVARRKGIWSSPAYHDARVYFGAYNGVVYCLDARTGQQIWANSHGEWIGASPVVVPRHNLLYIGIEYERPWAQGSVTALDVATGNKVWEHQTRKYQHGSPAYWQEGDLIIWGTADHVMAGFEAKTGKVAWRFKTGRSVKYAPAIDGDRRLVAFASFDKSIYILDVATGQRLGSWATGEICYTTPLFFQGKLFCGSGDRMLYIIDLDRMELIKKLETQARIYSSPRAIGNRVIFGTCGGRLIEIDAGTLEIEGVLQLPDAITNGVAISDDQRFVYVSTYMNQLFAFERLALDRELASLPSQDCIKTKEISTI
jgi:orotate phosphoribosyltransferase